VNVTERVASLEALLARVKKNAAEPRALSPRAAPQLYPDPARAEAGAGKAAQELSPFEEDAGLPGEPNAWDTEETAIFTYPPSFQDAPHQPLPRPMEPAPIPQATAKAAPDPAKQPAPKLTPTGAARVKIDPSKVLAALRDAPVVAKGDTDRSPIDFSAALKAATERRGPPVEVRDATPIPTAEPAKTPPVREAAAAGTSAPKPAERSPQPPAAKVEAPLPRVEPVAAKVEPKPAAPKAEPKPIVPRVEPIAAAPRAEPIAAAPKAEPIAAAPKAEPIAAAAKAEPKPIAAREEPKAAPFVPVKPTPAATLSASRRTAAKTLMGGLTAEDLKLPVEPTKAAPVRATSEGEPSAAKAESVLEEALLAAMVMPSGGAARPEARAEAPVASPTPSEPIDPFAGKALVMDQPRAAAIAAPVEPAKAAQPAVDVVKAAAAEAAPIAAKVTAAPADADIKKAEPKAEPVTTKEEPAAAQTGESPQSRHEVTTPSKHYAPPTPTAEPPRRGRGKLVAGAIAALVVGGGLFYGMREGWFDAGPRPVPTVPSPVSAVPITTGPTPDTPATVSAVPTTSGAPVAPEAVDAGLAADAATADAAPADAGSAIAPGGDPASLPADMGYITITSPAEGNLYLNGKFAGRAGERIQTSCGAKFARLARAVDPPAVQPSFLTTGETIVIPCQKAASVALHVGQPNWNQPPPPDPY
jgi:hypothetical protein